ncbi:WYL domain-containing protein [Halodesulfovibrio sp.]|uniref:WYL domain-containing protein n=1 Tax=Halodesulfovibrio sp. TaxID=1912772 RepID=UPI0025C232E5|nr:WYL domain-containing protein [Halodesulfovibrio sp.]
MPHNNNDTTYGYKLLDLFISLMVNGNKQFLSDLAAKYNCSKTTILNLIKNIEEVIGSNLETGIEKRKRWYRIASYNSRQTFALDFEELRFLNIYKDLAHKILPTEAAKRIGSTIMNLSCLLSDRDYPERHNAQQQQVWFSTKGYIDYSMHQKEINTFLSAITNKKFCYVTYTPLRSATPKEYFYAPERIVFSNNAYYVLGHKVSRNNNQEIRPTNLAVHRIKEVTPTNQTFSYEVKENNLGYFGLKWHEPKEFSIFFTPKVAPYIKERTWSSYEYIEEDDEGNVVLTIASTSELELEAWIRSFGSDAELISTRRHKEHNVH